MMMNSFIMPLCSKKKKKQGGGSGDGIFRGAVPGKGDIE